MPMSDITSFAVVLEAPRHLSLERLDLTAPGPGDVVVDVAFSGISTGTERLLWSGQMPAFPGMGYPLVPGYESVGTVSHAGPSSGRRADGVRGARCDQPGCAHAAPQRRLASCHGEGGLHV